LKAQQSVYSRLPKCKVVVVILIPVSCGEKKGMVNRAAVRSWKGKIKIHSAETRSGSPAIWRDFRKHSIFYNQVEPLYLKK